MLAFRVEKFDSRSSRATVLCRKICEPFEQLKVFFQKSCQSFEGPIALLDSFAHLLARAGGHASK